MIPISNESVVKIKLGSGQTFPFPIKNPIWNSSLDSRAILWNMEKNLLVCLSKKEVFTICYL